MASDVSGYAGESAVHYRSLPMAPFDHVTVRPVLCCIELHPPTGVVDPELPCRVRWKRTFWDFSDRHKRSFERLAQFARERTLVAAKITSANHLIGLRDHGLGYLEMETLCGLQVNPEVELCRPLDGQVSRPVPL
jgi:hypothetical protein